MNTNTKTPLPLLKRLEEINELIPWNMTPSCNQAKKELEELIAEREQSRTKEETIPKSRVRALIKDKEKKITEIPRYDLGRGLDDELEIEINLLKTLLE